jgi:hypothetical protein
MQSNDVNAATVNGKEAAYFGVPWEDAYGYAQAIKVGETRRLSIGVVPAPRARVAAHAVRENAREVTLIPKTANQRDIGKRKLGCAPVGAQPMTCCYRLHDQET